MNDLQICVVFLISLHKYCSLLKFIRSNSDYQFAILTFVIKCLSYLFIANNILSLMSMPLAKQSYKL